MAVVVDLYSLLTGATSGGTWTLDPNNDNPEPVPGSWPISGGSTANIDMEGLAPGEYDFKYQAPNTCGTLPPFVIVTIDLKDTPMSAIPAGPLYFCPKNNAAPANQVVTNTPTRKSDGAAWTGPDGPLSYTWEVTGFGGVGTGNNIAFVPAGPYTSEQINKELKGLVADQQGAPICTTSDALTFHVAPNVNLGMGSNLLFCQGSSTPYNVNTLHIMGASIPNATLPEPTGGNNANPGIKRKIRYTAGPATLPKFTSGNPGCSGGTLTLNTWYGWEEFQCLNLSAVALNTEIFFEYQTGYRFSVNPTNESISCPSTSNSFKVTISAQSSSGSPVPVTYCNN